MDENPPAEAGEQRRRFGYAFNDLRYYCREVVFDLSISLICKRRWN